MWNKGFIILMLAFFQVAAFAQQNVLIEKVVAQVGEEIILLSDIEERYVLQLEKLGVAPPDFKCNIIKDLMIEKLLIDQARIDSIIVTDNEIESQIDLRIDNILGQMNNNVEFFEEFYGKSVREIRSDFRDDIENLILANRVNGTLTEGIKVTPSEVVTLFNSIPKDSLPIFNSEVEYRELVYSPRVNDVEKSKALTELEEIKQNIIDSIITFEEAATKYSDDYGSAQFGGDLGWQKRGSFVPEFEATAYRLDRDEISDIVETEFGFHLLQLLERRGNTINVRHILITPTITEADEEKAVNFLDSIRNLILIDSLSFTGAVAEFGNDKTASFNNAGRVSNNLTGNTYFEVGDLDPEVYFSIDSLEVLDITRPVETLDPTGKKQFRLFQLDSRSAPHQANLKQDYSKLQDFTKSKKTNDKLEVWVKDKVASTYLWMDPLYECQFFTDWIVLQKSENQKVAKKEIRP